MREVYLEILNSMPEFGDIQITKYQIKILVG